MSEEKVRVKNGSNKGWNEESAIRRVRESWVKNIVFDGKEAEVVCCVCDLESWKNED